MSGLIQVTTVAALLSSAVVGGIFFAFSSFIMKALGKLPAAKGIAAMQSINIVVINASFLGLFVGGAVLSLLIGVAGIVNWNSPGSSWLVVGALMYLVGTFLVTGLGNVPLNNQLAATTADSTDVALWQHYLQRWTRLNTLRTLAAVGAALAFAIALQVAARAA